MESGSLSPSPCKLMRFGNFFKGRLSPNSSSESACTIQRNRTLEPQTLQPGSSRSRTSARQAEPQILQVKVCIRGAALNTGWHTTERLIGPHEVEDFEDGPSLVVVHRARHLFCIA